MENKEKVKSQEDKAPNLGGWGVKDKWRKSKK